MKVKDTIYREVILLKNVLKWFLSSKWQFCFNMIYPVVVCFNLSHLSLSKIFYSKNSCIYSGNFSLINFLYTEYSIFSILSSWNTLATWCEELTHLKRPWCWERLREGREVEHRGWEGWMASPTQWTWVWVDSGSCWWTGRPGELQFMGSQRVGHNWATKLLPPIPLFVFFHIFLYLLLINLAVLSILFSLSHLFNYSTAYFYINYCILQF